MPEEHTRLLADRYELTAPLGRGTMGTVWRAWDRSLGREVAVKQIRRDPGLTAEQQAELRERMIREARLAARFNHPSVATVHDAIVVDGLPWIIMELVEGRSLEQVIEEEGPLPPRLVAQIGVDLLSALRAAHAQGILHRDVKPSNVLLTDTGRVVLTDFGIAKAAGDSDLTKTGMVIGSPGYTAPERARGEYAGPESDLWSLGATLYFAVEGRPAYERGSVAATLAALMTETAEPPTQAGPLRPIIEGLLEKDHTLRLTAEQADAMLRAVADGRAPDLSATARPVHRGDSADANRQPEKVRGPIDTGPKLVGAAAVSGIGVGQDGRDAQGTEPMGPTPYLSTDEPDGNRTVYMARPKSSGLYTAPRRTTPPYLRPPSSTGGAGQGAGRARARRRPAGSRGRGRRAGSRGGRRPRPAPPRRRVRPPARADPRPTSRPPWSTWRARSPPRPRPGPGSRARSSPGSRPPARTRRSRTAGRGIPASRASASRVQVSRASASTALASRLPVSTASARAAPAPYPGGGTGSYPPVPDHEPPGLGTEIFELSALGGNELQKRSAKVESRTGMFALVGIALAGLAVIVIIVWSALSGGSDDDDKRARSSAPFSKVTEYPEDRVPEPPDSAGETGTGTGTGDLTTTSDTAAKVETSDASAPGLRRHADPSGFTVDVPDGMTASSSGRTVRFADGTRTFTVTRLARPQPAVLDAVLDAERRSVDAGEYPDYRMLQINPVTPAPYRGATVADWEFTYTRDGGTVHVLSRWVTVSGATYVLRWSAPEDTWQRDAGQRRAVFGSFTPGGGSAGS